MVCCAARKVPVICCGVVRLVRAGDMGRVGDLYIDIKASLDFREAMLCEFAFGADPSGSYT